MDDAKQYPITAREVCDALGRRAISERVRRSITAVSNAAVDGVFPSSWYLVIREMCAEADIECPDAVFRFEPTLTTSPNQKAS